MDTHRSPSVILAPLPPLQLLDLPDELLAAVTTHLRPADAATEATALAIRATCVRLREAARSSLGPALNLNLFGERHCSPPAFLGGGHSLHPRRAVPFRDVPTRTATLCDRVAAAVALLAPPSGVRSLTIRRPHGVFIEVGDDDVATFSGAGHLGPLLTAAGRLPLHTLTVGPLGAEVVDRAVAPGTRPRDTLRRLHVRGFLASCATEAAVGATLAAVAPRLVALSLEGFLVCRSSLSVYPTAGMLRRWAVAAPPADALREFAFHGQLSVADATALTVWAPHLTYLKLTLYETAPEAAAALALPALPHLRRLDQHGHIPHVEVLLAGRPLTSVTVVLGGVPDARSNQEALVRWLTMGPPAAIASLATDMGTEDMTLAMFGPTTRLHSSSALRTLVLRPLVDRPFLPHVARLPHLAHLALNFDYTDCIGNRPADVAALGAFPALRSLSVFARDFDGLRPLLAAASRLPASVTTLRLMVDTWLARGRPWGHFDLAPERRVAVADDGRTAGAAAGASGGVGGAAAGAAAPPGLARLYFGFSRTERATPGRAPLPAAAFFALAPPGLVLAGELASPPVGWVDPPGGSPVVPAAGWVCGWALA